MKKLWIALLACALTMFAASAYAQATKTFNLNWTDNADNEDGFAVNRKIGTGAYVEVMKIVGANVISYSDTVNAPYGTAICYTVSAYNASGYSGLSNEACAAMPPILKPNPPSNLTISKLTNQSFRLSWANSDPDDIITQVDVWRKGGKGAQARSYARLSSTPPDTVVYDDGSLFKSTSYCYKVQNVASVVTSDFSNEACGTTGR